MKDWLIIDLKAPLMSFGDVTVDSYNPTRDFPSKSMIVGMIGSALGVDREEGERLQDIQDRMLFGCAILEEGTILEDMQNAQISKTDVAWQTSGKPASRRGNIDTYKAPERRARYYIEDGHVQIALRMQGKGGVTTDEVQKALNFPKHPLFIGRKHCIPSVPLVTADPYESAPTAYEALRKRTRPGLRAQWDADDGPTDGPSVYQITSVRDIKNWLTDTHQGERRVVEGDT
jgi:CRISPR system Cascade subunit CasD